MLREQKPWVSETVTRFTTLKRSHSSSFDPFSLGRDAFVPAGELRRGERLRPRLGSAAVSNVYRKPEAENVFNIEVSVQHVYCVTSQGILVHHNYIREDNFFQWINPKNRSNYVKALLDNDGYLHFSIRALDNGLPMKVAGRCLTK